jgi:hypothetical protein
MRTERVGGRKRTVYLHRVIAPTPAGVEVYHINRDGLDNRRANLRHRATPDGGSFDSVAYNKRTGRWMAQIATSGQPRFMGYFNTPEAAAAKARAVAGRHG